MTSSPRRPLVRNRTAAAAAGVGCFVLGWVLLHDAYGTDQPAWLRPFTWW